ncbi:hypothetical protein ACP275_13G057900 [Erythranthe tilingii]
MAAISEHRSKRRRNQNTVSIDRISDLPDEVIFHILSFLQTKFSVRTSILSRRWRYLWSYVPNLHFHNENQGGIIDRVLSLHKLQSIATFRATDWIHRSDYQIEKWITFAVERNVRNLHLNCRQFDIVLPQCLFTCKTLVDLRLESCGVIPNLGGAMFLPRLKKLHLIQVQYEGDESLPHLLSGCPVLEELSIELFIDYSSCKISSHTVKRLVINSYFDGGGYDYEGYHHRLEINTPALVYLQLFDYSTQYIKCGELTALTEADIYICNNVKPEDGFLYSRSLMEFIDRLHNVKCLKLNLLHCTEIIDSVFSTWERISFHNLTKLELTTDCCFLSKFLENANNLEILILSEVFEEIKGWTEPQQVPACLLSHLRTIKLDLYVGKEHRFKLMRYLLNNARILERMQLVYPRSLDPTEKIYMLREIPLFERGSRACKLSFFP